MPRNVCTFTWQGAAYSFARLRDPAGDGSTAEWAIARTGEFIGTMSCAVNITTSEFEVCCMRWLSDLLGCGGGRRG